MSSMRDHQGTSLNSSVGPRPRLERTIHIMLWFGPSTSFRSIFTISNALKRKLQRLDLILLLLWAMLRVGVYLILLVLLAYVGLLFFHLWDLRFSPHSTLLPSSTRANGPIA